jgi:Predicted aminomethyltransferase related to GcvT
MDKQALDPQRPMTLASYQLLQLEGEDAAKFFQGYGTCDTRVLDGSQARLGALCNRQGQSCKP